MAEKVPWKNLEDIFSEEECRQWRNEIEDELSSESCRANAIKNMAHGQTLRHDGQALFLLGPSACGKSYALTEGSIEVPQGAITLDGGYIRDSSLCWSSALSKAALNELSGFSNFFKDYFKEPMDKLKKSIVKESISSRANIVVPDTASSLRSCLAMVDRLLDAGYNLSFAAIIAPKEVCEQRGISRESKEGKKSSSKNWKASVRAIIEMEDHLRARGLLAQVGGVRVFDNSSTFKETNMDAVRSLLGMPVTASSESSSQHNSEGHQGWLEIRLLAGSYTTVNKNVVVTFDPLDFHDEIVDVRVTRYAKQDAGEGPVDVEENRVSLNTYKFSCSDCCIDKWELLLSETGRPMLKSSEELLTWVRDIPGKSLKQGLVEVAPILKGCQFLGSSGAFRKMEDAEFEQASEKCGFKGKESTKSDQPRALFVVAPSAGGKTTVLRKFAEYYEMSVDDSVIIDGAEFRDFHAQYRAILKNGFSNGGLWYSAWPAAKKVISGAKRQMIKDASVAKRNLFISDTGADINKTLEEISKLRSLGYLVHLCGIFADPQEIIARGIAREVEDGKRYNRDIDKLCCTFDAFGPAIQAINGKFKLIHNGQGKSPSTFMDGDGGAKVDFNLEEAIDSCTTLEVARLSPQELAYIQEGNLNIVCAYHGTNEDWENMVLRCRKGDNSTYRRDCMFAKSVAARMVGSEYIDTGELVAVPSADMVAIDEAIFGLRPEKRRAKRLDTTVRDACGSVLALKVPNLMAAPLDAKVVTVELKPKCGLRERLGLPSRYTLLQYEKLKAGKIEKLSSYDPIKLLSGDRSLISEALQACIEEPQNNLRIFIDGKQMFSEDALKKSDRAVVMKALEEQLNSAKFRSLECLLSVLSGVLSSATMMMPSRLKRVQCWASGETAVAANQLLGLLRKRFKETHGDSADARLEIVLSDPKNFKIAIDDVAKFPLDEQGIAVAVREMDNLFEKANKSWNADIEKEVIRWLCRFLLGRTCHDVSVLINFVVVEPEKRSEALKRKLKRLRFQSLDYKDAPDSLDGDNAWTDIWFRTSVVDTDAKSYEKLPEYAGQLDEYVEAYWNRHGKGNHKDAKKMKDSMEQATSTEETKTVRIQFDAKAAICKVQEQKASASSVHEAVGGHDDSVVFEDDVVWKKMQIGVRGSTEFIVLRHFFEDPSAKDVVPALVGIRMDNGSAYIGMKNILHGLQNPALMDVKMGTRTWNTFVPQSKVESQSRKAMETTTGSLGLRVVGGKMINKDGEIERWSYKKTDDPIVKVKDLKDSSGLKEIFAEFLCTPTLLRSALENVEKAASFWDSQHKYAFYASSLLFAYDNATKDVCRVGLIDFANAEEISDKSEDVSGYSVGLDTLRKMISDLQH